MKFNQNEPGWPEQPTTISEEGEASHADQAADPLPYPRRTGRLAMNIKTEYVSQLCPVAQIKGGRCGRALPPAFHTLAKDMSLIEAQHILHLD